MVNVMSRQETIREITRRLVKVYRPERIYLVGSEARGDAGPDSDLDFLIVVPDDASRELRGAAIFQQHRLDIREPIDLVIVRRRYFEENRKVRTDLPFAAETEGLVLYEQPAA
jgi:predicted nucleotidyltransferase